MEGMSWYKSAEGVVMGQKQTADTMEFALSECMSSGSK